MQLFRKKSVTDILKQVEERQLNEGEHSLAKHLGVRDLTAFGIAAIIGAGIFSTIGQAIFGRIGDRNHVGLGLMHILSNRPRNGMNI